MSLSTTKVNYWDSPDWGSLFPDIYIHIYTLGMATSNQLTEYSIESLCIGNQNSSTQ